MLALPENYVKEVQPSEQQYKLRLTLIHFNRPKLKWSDQKELNELLLPIYFMVVQMNKVVFSEF